jgi:hypothetical protein
MGRFHDRMDDDLRIRGYSANTRASYPNFRSSSGSGS